MTAHLKAVGHPDGGPTTQCKLLFWATLLGWAVALALTWKTGSIIAALWLGFMASWLGAHDHDHDNIMLYMRAHPLRGASSARAPLRPPCPPASAAAACPRPTPRPGCISPWWAPVRTVSAGAFGHNWVHQPKYKHWAYLSLDTIGFSSDGWFREHVLQHHM